MNYNNELSGLRRMTWRSRQMVNELELVEGAQFEPCRFEFLGQSFSNSFVRYFRLFFSWQLRNICSRSLLIEPQRAARTTQNHLVSAEACLFLYRSAIWETHVPVPELREWGTHIYSHPGW